MDIRGTYRKHLLHFFFFLVANMTLIYILLYVLPFYLWKYEFPDTEYLLYIYFA